jgi:O-antigen/teichoic acid export membrane protein
VSPPAPDRSPARSRVSVGRPSTAALTGVGFLLFARVAAGVATFALFALLARTLSRDEFGLFGLAWSVSYLFAAAVESGYGMLVVREVAKSPDRVGHFLGAFLPIRLGVALIIATAAAIGSETLGWGSTPVVLLIAAAAANLQVVSGIPREFLIATDHPEWAGVHAFVETVLRTGVILATAAATGSVSATFIAAVGFHAAWAGLSLLIVWRVYKPVGVLKGARQWRGVLRQSLPFGAFIILGALYGQMDVVIVSSLLPLAAVAAFQIAIRILVSSDYVAEAAWRWAYPRLSRSSALPGNRFAGQTTRMAASLMSIGAIGAILLIAIAPFGIPLAFGSQYTSAVLPTQLMAGAIPLRYGAHVYGTALSAAGLQGTRTRLFLAVLVLTAIAETIAVLTTGLDVVAVVIVGGSGALLAAYFLAARRAWHGVLDGRPLALVVVFVAALVAGITFAR